MVILSQVKFKQNKLYLTCWLKRIVIFSRVFLRYTLYLLRIWRPFVVYQSENDYVYLTLQLPSSEPNEKFSSVPRTGIKSFIKHFIYTTILLQNWKIKKIKIWVYILGKSGLKFLFVILENHLLLIDKYTPSSLFKIISPDSSVSGYFPSPGLSLSVINSFANTHFISIIANFWPTKELFVRLSFKLLRQVQSNLALRCKICRWK